MVVLKFVDSKFIISFVTLSACSSKAGVCCEVYVILHMRS